MQTLCIASLILIICQMSFAAKCMDKKSDEDSTRSDELACYNFSVGNPQKKEFFSPNYPNDYPRNIMCSLRIKADVGHMVMLDFRDVFSIETSPTCEYDYLEVRDGAYGYSPPLGKFCGHEFPIKLYSTKRYMWLQFKSDDTIEYKGFKAVYDYVPISNRGDGDDNEIECSFHRTGPSGIISKSEVIPLLDKYRHEDAIECMWTIVTESGKQLYMNFLSYKLYKPNDCDQNFIQIFDGGRTPDKECIKFCGTTAEPQKTSTNMSYVRFFTHKDAFKDTDFKLHYTAFRPIEKDDECDPKLEFSCADQTCIDVNLKCDGHDDCKYAYDEEKNTCAHALGAGMDLTSEHMIIILVVFFSLVVAMCASISISCYNKIKERKLREKEYKERRSKEASVEATIERNIRGHSSPDRVSEVNQKRPAAFDQVAVGFRDEADDEESSDGCYVPEVDVSTYKHPNGGESIPKKGGVGRDAGLQQARFPYISESFESLESDVIVPPAPPPVPMHMKERRDLSPPPPTYRIVGGKVVANPAKNEPSSLERLESQRPTLDTKGGSNYGRWGTPENAPTKSVPPPSSYSPYKPGEKTKPLADKNTTGPTDGKANFLRGPLEAGAPRSAFTRSPGEIGLPKFGMARVTPDGPRGPLAAKGASGSATEKGLPLATFRSPYEDPSYPKGYRTGTPRSIRNNPEPLRAQASTEPSDKDSSRAHSVASTLSAPDVIGKR